MSLGSRAAEARPAERSWSDLIARRSTLHPDPFARARLIGFALAALALSGPLTGRANAQGDSGFMTGEGRSYLAFSYARDTIDEYSLGDDATELDGEVVREAFSFYFSHGVSDELDLWLNASYSLHTADDSLDLPDEEAWQDLFVGLRYRFWSEEQGPGRLSFLFSPSFKTPLTDYDTDTITAIGDGQDDLMLHVVAQYVWDSGPYIAVETGYDLRFGDPDDQIPFHLTVGDTFFERLTIAPFYSYVDSLGGDTLGTVSGRGQGQGTGTGNLSLASVEEDYEAIGVGAYLRLTDSLGLSFSYRSTIDGSNTGLGDAYAIGVLVGL